MTVLTHSWQEVRYYKNMSPVWGRTPESGFSFKSGPLGYIKRIWKLSFNQSPWGKYKLKGKMAEDEIKRASTNPVLI